MLYEQIHLEKSLIDKTSIRETNVTSLGCSWPSETSCLMCLSFETAWFLQSAMETVATLQVSGDAASFKVKAIAIN